MKKVLLAVDGTEESESAIWAVVTQARQQKIDRVHVANVQPAFDGLVRHFVGSSAIRAYQREAGETALAPARQILEYAGVEYEIHIRSGDAATQIMRLAQELRVDEIVISSESDGLIDTFLQRILIARLVRRSRVPVVVIRPENRLHQHDIAAARRA